MNKYKHIMIDIETLGKKDNAVICSVGAVCFNSSDDLTDCLSIVFPVQEQIEKGRSIDASTLEFWRDNDLRYPSDENKKVTWSLDCLAQFIRNHSIDRQLDDDGTFIWAHGVTFDITKLQSLYSDFNLPVPWEYWQIMDCRTMVQLWPEAREMSLSNNHVALDDAKNQVHWLKTINTKLGFL